MSFTWERIHKWDENIESKITEEAYDYVEDFYGVDDIYSLTEDQIREISEFVEDPNTEYYLMCVGLRSIISSWECENGDLE